MSRSKSKAAGLSGTLHDAESKQLEQFVKSRSKDLDREIEQMKKRLGSGASLNIMGKSLTATEGHTRAGDLAINMNDLRQQDESSSPEHSPRGHHGHGHHHHRHSKGESRSSSPRGESHVEFKEVKSGSLRDFLKLIKIKMEDVNMSPEQLRDMLLPSDLNLPSDVTVSIAELSLALQTDLVLPVTRDDQLAVLKQYGAPNGDVDLCSMLTDAGVWSERQGAKVPGGHGVGAEMALSRVRGGQDTEVTISRYDEEDAKRKALAGRERLSPDEQEHERTLQRMHRASGSVMDDSEVKQVQFAAAMKDVSAAIPEGTAPQVSAKDLASQSRADEEKFAASLEKIDGLLPESNRAKAAYGDLLDRSEKNGDALQDMHYRVAQEKALLAGEQLADDIAAGHVPAEAPAPPKPSVRLPESVQTEVDSAVLDRDSGDGLVNAPRPLREETERNAVFAIPSSSPHPGDQDLPPPTASASPRVSQSIHGDQQLTMKESALLEENARLKAELTNFDGEFWEQLEDLKYRYKSLQGVVGRDGPTADFLRGHSAEGAITRPMYPDRQRSMAQYGDTAAGIASTGSRRSADGLPLTSVSWAKRDSRTAMASAAMDTPLVRGRYGNTATVGPSSNTNKTQTYGSGSQPPTRGTTAALHDRGYDTQIQPPASSASVSGRPAPLLRHSTGAFPSGPLIGEKESNSGSLASMVERRLLFELGNHPSPETAVQQLIHRVVDVAAKTGHHGRYLTPHQLVDCMSSVGLRMDAKEVNVFAAGFGSDGRGGVDCEEMCEALQALLYNFVGEHDNLNAKRGVRVQGLEAEEAEERKLQDLLETLAGDIVAHDKKAILGAGLSIYDTLQDPFLRADTARAGVLPFSAWASIMGDLGAMLDRDELVSLSSYFESKQSSASSAQYDQDDVVSFRDKQAKGMLRGAAKSDPKFGKWLEGSGTGIGLEDQDEPLVCYSALVGKLTQVIEAVIESGGGLVAGPGMRKSKGGGKGDNSREVDLVEQGLWMLREFELIENLICQLELMKPNNRRRCLMSLQYALAAADVANDGEVDGFTLLSALLGAGFRLQRLNRVRLLKAVEELGGKMDYSELCQVLLRSCADWTSEERGLVSKILKSMGITVLERRAWIGRLRVALMSASVEFGKKQAAAAANTLAAYTGAASSGKDTDPGIPPSNFLHVLRDCGVVLSVEEEATLLDCLDTERLSELSAIERNKKEKTVASNATFGAWGVPLVYYKSFLAFCSRHTGDWSDAAPETTTAVYDMLKSVSDPMKGLHEFSSLLQAFDEGNTGRIGNRAFQIVCHRARLFANLSEKQINILSDILTAEGGGRIKYTSFLVHMRIMCGQVMNEQNAAIPDIAEQLLKNATDTKGTLLPLRNWLLRNTDVESCQLTLKDFNNLLREFSVLYRPDDLRDLLMEIGSAGPNVEPLDKTVGDAENGNEKPDPTNNDGIDTRDLFRHLYKIRGPWMPSQPYLCSRMVKSLTMTGANIFTGTPGDTPADGAGSGAGAGAFGYPKGPQGVETAAARRLLARLRAFTDITSFDVSAAGAAAGGGEGRMVELDIFGAISKSCGLPLGDEELLILADATDCHPLANRIRADVVLECISYENSTSGKPSGGEEEEGKKATKKSILDQDLSETAQFALKHIKDQIWNTCKRVQRSPDEWISDVNAVFRGFDSGGVGFITTDDFTLGLSLLNAPVSAEILRDIPSVPEGPGMISYKDILNALMVPPASMQHNTSKKDKENVSSSSRGPNSSAPKTMSVSGKSALASKKKPKSMLTQEEKDKQEQELAVNMLVTVIRKSVKQFILNDSSLEEAWLCIVRAFRRFDPVETGKVPPRDFCLAVSVLLEGDEVLLTESQWTDIIAFFTAVDPRKAKREAASNPVGAPASGAQLVDYMEFASLVLDVDECKKVQAMGQGSKTAAAKRGAHGSRR